MRCVPLRIHLHAGPSLQARQAALRHTRRQMRWANARFETLGIRLVATELVWLTASAARVDSGTKRDQIGRFAWKKGAILWVGPTALVDLNGHTVRHGVHWRDRKDQRGELRRRRWVIVARTPYVFVLAHELGHYFGLPHSRAPRSLMNKRSTPGRPGVRDWRFTRKEGQRVQRRLGQLRRAGTLTLLKRMPAIDPLSSPARH